MKIGMISDLHIDINEKALQASETAESLVTQMILDQKLDILLIAGDISNHYEKSQKFLEDIQETTNVQVFFTPGNHDYWSKEHEVKDTNQIDAFFTSKKESLVGNPKILNDEWAIVGSPGWYDYGYGDHQKYSIEQFDKKKYKFASWNDRHYVDWVMDDQSVSKRMLDQLTSDMESVGKRKIILMTHVATHSEFVVPLPNRIYDYANGFLGAKSYESLYTKYPQIKYSLMGHVHFRKTYRDTDRTYISACIGNKRHWSNKNFKAQLEKTLVVIDL
ncbi:metallophosphoesterase [Marinilactibacillus sp. Marseille-P9653]|uniref:metallophosphoesterase n=1 Tax=Marinilactibacillus sp. Marseille-P9653 TaxID=2866583 RepID=UPI001CE4158A|nr:metallophosphoesterase [Marinilactibacillus sp. Marseille-P9653]